MRAREHENRLADRSQQTRGWAAPLPSPDALSRVREGDGARLRMEWDTRDTMNNRLWDATVSTGPKTVTSAMLASHPTGGANIHMPIASRHDARIWSSATVATVAATTAAAAAAPTMSSIYKSPMFTGMDVDKVGLQELRGAIREDSRYRDEHTSRRITERMFDTQWVPKADAARIVAEQIAAADKLRFGADDWTRQYRPTA